MNNNNKTWLPLLVAFAIAFFIYLGMWLESVRSTEDGAQYVPINRWFGERDGGLTSSEASSKLIYLFDLLRDRYVDTLDLKTLVETAIPTIIEELDPHSLYIPAEELSSVNEQLEGSFSGIGVQFNIQNDTAMVISVISGGPSEKVGLMPGDRIVSVNDTVFVGKQVTNETVMKTLRGAKGSTVRVGIRRSTAEEELKFDIVRDDIPVNSVVASYLLDDGIGYIKVDNFGRNTFSEFFSMLIQLKSRGATGYLIDLRGNGGGYMEVCCQMVNEFLPKNALIVYTEGQSVARSEVRADGRGAFQQDPVVVLIDEWSASASEILAGAIQDNDRGTIVGRRSFGKGLVQQQFDLNDGSALRLTISRYHTPSGRCIQKAYTMGGGEDYSRDLMNRYEHGEFYSKDSIHLADSLQFQTIGGRTVYAGGGIMPDIFVPSDTSAVTPYYNKCINTGVCYSFAFQYSDKHRELISAFNDFVTLETYLRSQHLMDAFVKFAAPKVKPVPAQIAQSRASLERLIIAFIMRQCKDENFFYREFYSDDPAYLEGIRILREGKAWPNTNQ